MTLQDAKNMVQEGNIKPVLDFLQEKFKQSPPREIEPILPKKFLEILQDDLGKVKNIVSTLAKVNPLSKNEYTQRVLVFISLGELKEYWETKRQKNYIMIMKNSIYLLIGLVFLAFSVTHCFQDTEKSKEKEGEKKNNETADVLEFTGRIFINDTILTAGIISVSEVTKTGSAINNGEFTITIPNRDNAKFHFDITDVNFNHIVTFSESVKVIKSKIKSSEGDIGNIKLYTKKKGKKNDPIKPTSETRFIKEKEMPDSKKDPEDNQSKKIKNKNNFLLKAYFKNGKQDYVVILLGKDTLWSDNIPSRGFLEDSVYVPSTTPFTAKVHIYRKGKKTQPIIDNVYFENNQPSELMIK